MKFLLWTLLRNNPTFKISNIKIQSFNTIMTTHSCYSIQSKIYICSNLRIKGRRRSSTTLRPQRHWDAKKHNRLIIKHSLNSSSMINSRKASNNWVRISVTCQADCVSFLNRGIRNSDQNNISWNKLNRWEISKESCH